MKIALTTPFSWPYVRRGNRFVHELASFLGNCGHEVHIITTKPGTVSRRTTLDNVTVDYNQLEFNPLFSLLKINFYETFIPACFRALHREDFDIVQTLWPPDGFAASLHKSFKGTPFVHLVVDTIQFFLPSLFGKRMFERVLKTASRLVVPSEFVNSELCKHFGVTGDLISMTVDTEFFKPLDGNKSLFPRILCTSSLLSARKRLHLLIKAFEIVLDHRPEAILQLSGHVLSDMATAEVFMELVSPKTRESIELLGTGELQDMPALYRDAAITVLPSLNEAFGMVIIESLACGTPFVGTRSGAIPEIIDSPEIGVLFEPKGEEKELAKAILKGIELSENPQTTEKCRRRAEKYSWNSLGHRYEQLLLEVSEGRSCKKGYIKRRVIKENTQRSDSSHASVKSKGMIKNKTLDRIFNEALDELDISYEVYYMLDQYKPRCLSVLNWLTKNLITDGKVLILSRDPRLMTILFEKLGYGIKKICSEPRKQPWKAYEAKSVLHKLEELNNLNEKYDIIVCDDLLQYFEYPLKMLKLLKTYLDSKGVMVLATINATRWASRLRLLAGKNIYPSQRDAGLNNNFFCQTEQMRIPYREYTLSELKNLMTLVGLELMEYRCLAGRKPFLIRWGEVPLKPYVAKTGWNLIGKFFSLHKNDLFIAARNTVSSTDYNQ